MECFSEKCLLWAIVKRAVQDACGNFSVGNSGEGCHLQRSADAWLFAKGGVAEAFSFLWICDELGIDPARVRKFVNRYRNKKNILISARGSESVCVISRILETTNDVASMPQLRRKAG